MVDRLMDLTGGLAGRIGDMFGVQPGAAFQGVAPAAQYQQVGAAAQYQQVGTGPGYNAVQGGAGFAPVSTNDAYGWMAQHGAQARFPQFFVPPATSSNGSATGTNTQALSYPGGGTASRGLEPGVAKWAAQAQQVFGDIPGLDPDTMLAIMTNESHGDPNAYNAAGDAWGLFQQVGLGSNDPNAQFAAAHQLAQQKMAALNASYAQNGLNPDARTRARDFALAWAGHFDYGTGQPNPNSRDIGSGQTAAELTNVFLANYDRIKAGRTQAQGAQGAQGGTPAVQKALSLVGTPYVLGGLRGHPNDPTQGLDCSELVGYAYGLPQSLWNAQALHDHTLAVASNDLQAGDLVYFSGTDPSNSQPITHVGIYIGNGQFVNAQDQGVMVANLNDPYWQAHYAGAGRLGSQSY